MQFTQRLEKLNQEPDAAASPITRKAEIEYLVDLLPQLRKMALSLEETTLAYLLEMAMIEAKLKLDIEESVPTMISIAKSEL
jgi:hypothetical protein